MHINKCSSFPLILLSSIHLTTPFVIFFFLTIINLSPSVAIDIGPIVKHSSELGTLKTVDSDKRSILDVIEIDIKNEIPYKDVGYYFLNQTDKMYYHGIAGHSSIKCNSDFTFGPPLLGSKTFMNWVNRINCKFTMYKNCYISPTSIIFNNQYEIKPNNCTYQKIYNFVHGFVVRYESYIIAGAIIYSKVNYYHTLFDGIYPIMMVPELYRRNAKILFIKMKNYQKEFFLALGLYDKVIELNADEYVFASRVIIPTHPRTHFVHFGPGLKTMSELFRKNLNVSHIKPTKYSFINRPPNTKRRIKNAHELFDAIKLKIPEIPWVMEEDLVSDSLQLMARKYAEILLFITIPGANSIKTIFRPPGTINVFVNSNAFDYEVYIIPAALGQKFVWFMTSNFDHYGQPCYIDPVRFVEACSIAVKYLKDGQWPSPKEYAFIDYLEKNYDAPSTKAYGLGNCIE